MFWYFSKPEDKLPSGRESNSRLQKNFVVWNSNSACFQIQVQCNWLLCCSKVIMFLGMQCWRGQASQLSHELDFYKILHFALGWKNPDCEVWLLLQMHQIVMEIKIGLAVIYTWTLCKMIQIICWEIQSWVVGMLTNQFTSAWTHYMGTPQDIRTDHMVGYFQRISIE